MLPSNDIVGLTEQLNGRMALMGVWDFAVDRVDASEEEIRKEARRACEDYGHLKMFIPSITYGDPFGTIYPRTGELFTDEVAKYNQERFGIS